MNEWNIQSRAHACEVCAKPFADKQPYHTLLFDQPPELRRSDVCDVCAQKDGAARSRAGFVSHWVGIYEAPAPVVDAIQKETAVMLERKRILKVKEQLVRDGQRVFVYEQPKTGDIFTIADPDLRLDQLEEVQRDVAMLLENGLNPPVPTAEDPAPTAEPVATEDEPAIVQQ